MLMRCVDAKEETSRCAAGDKGCAELTQSNCDWRTAGATSPSLTTKIDTLLLLFCVNRKMPAIET